MEYQEKTDWTRKLSAIVVTAALIFAVSSTIQVKAGPSVNSVSTPTDAQGVEVAKQESLSDSYRALYGYGSDSIMVRIFDKHEVMRRVDVPELVRGYAEELPIFVDGMSMTYDEYAQILPEDIFDVYIGEFYYEKNIIITTGFKRIGSNKLIVPEDNPYYAIIEKKKAENNGEIPYVHRTDPMKTCRIFIDGEEIENNGNPLDGVDVYNIESIDYNKAENKIFIQFKK